MLTATANHHKCGADGCLFTYRLRLTDPMDRDVNVLDCALAEQSLRLPIIGQPGGLGISAGDSVTFCTEAVLPIQKSAARGLRGSQLTCTGLDWHGDPPI